MNTNTVRIIFKLATSKNVSSCSIDSSTHYVTLHYSIHDCKWKSHTTQIKRIIDLYENILLHRFVNVWFRIAVGHNNTQEAKAGQKYIFWTTNVSNWPSDQFTTHFTSEIFTRNSTEIIQIVLKTSAITSSWEKMLIRSDSKQRDVLNREKHGFPCRVL